MSNDKNDAIIGVAPNPSFGARLKAHFKKWWWVHLIVFCSVVLIIALPLVYVGYPNIAQDDIDESTLSINSMVISDPTPDGFYVEQEQVIGTSSIFRPQLFDFDAEVGLEGASSPFATVTVPDLQARDGAIVNVNQQLTFSNASAFAEFSIAAILNEEIGLTIRGTPKLKLGALPTINVDYDKVVRMKGLNKLSGLKIVKMNMGLELPNGMNTNGTVYIPNPSVMTITMGNVTLDISSKDGERFGTSILQDLVLPPGGGNFTMVANMDIGTIGNYIPTSEPFLLPLHIVGKSSSYDGKELPYFTAALAANPMDIDLDIISALNG